MTRSRKVLALCAAGAAAVTGTTVAAAAHPKLHLTAKDSGGLRFSPGKLHAHKGKVTLVMANPSRSSLAHGIAIGGHKGKVVGPGGTSRVTVRLKPGRYTYYCPVPGHRAAGMKGRLVVSS
jgi:uncharacterized cupredoxin-like copper-binding protein